MAEAGCDARDMAGRAYRLTVTGELSNSLASALDGMTLERVNGTTTFTAHARDQAELQGFLLRVADLGLTLVEVTTIDDEPDTEVGRRGGTIDDSTGSGRADELHD